MMKTYAYCPSGVIDEIIPPDYYKEDSPDGVDPPWLAGDYIPIERRFAPQFLESCVDITDMVPFPQLNWFGVEVDGQWTFAPFVPPVPTPEEILAKNQNDQQALLYAAGASMAPVLVSLNLGDSTEEEVVIAKQWQAYYRDLKLVDLTIENPEWPTPPESI